jgi:formylglycine-generating enzyme required for sulfatase activity
MMHKLLPVIWALIATSTTLSAEPFTADPWAQQPPVGEMLAGLLPQSGEAGYELAFWNSIKDSKNAADYEAYLQAYPNGRFAPLAKARAERYREAAKPAPAESAPAEPQRPSIIISVMNKDFRVTTTANVREQPSSAAKKIDELPKGSTVRVTGKVKDSDWYRVEIGRGAEGYVYAPLLTDKPLVVHKPEPKPKPVPIARPKPVPAPTPAPRPVAKGETFRDCSVCPEMVTLPAGSFVMGSRSGDYSEKPAHTVKITRPFAIGKYEVTVGQWKECMKARGCSHITDKAAAEPDNAPITDISWDDAREYVRWLSATTGETYRLPTEAEWEYAARAGSTTRYWWGDRMTPGKAYCKDCGRPWDRNHPAEVGSLAANPFGLHDTNGNVWEWVQDCWHKNYEGAPKDGSSWTEPDCRRRVIRGGSWRDGSIYIHSASRFYYDSYVRYLLNGLRVARVVK